MTLPPWLTGTVGVTAACEPLPGPLGVRRHTTGEVRVLLPDGPPPKQP